MLADARDHALLLVGWKAALRTDDLARLQMADLHAFEQGLSVHLSRSKTDQHGTGATIGIAAPSPETTAGEGSEESTLLDAGAAWVRWRDLLGSHGVVDGPLWRGIDRYGRRPRTGGLHRNSIAEIIRRRAAEAGLADAELWGGHSPPDDPTLTTITVRVQPLRGGQSYRCRDWGGHVHGWPRWSSVLHGDG